VKLKRPGIKYDPYRPFKVHRIGNSRYPYLVNQRDYLIDHNEAEAGFKKAASTVMTWGQRVLVLAKAQPVTWDDPSLDGDDDGGPRQYELEHLSWDLDTLEDFVVEMRKELDAAMGVTGKRILLEKIKRLEERPGTEHEGDNARIKRERLERELGESVG
jgi:hypothetical protein